jgi:hypothetical protein
MEEYQGGEPASLRVVRLNSVGAPAKLFKKQLSHLTQRLKFCQCGLAFVLSRKTRYKGERNFVCQSFPIFTSPTSAVYLARCLVFQPNMCCVLEARTSVQSCFEL